jgi:hypothetical protein
MMMATLLLAASAGATTYNFAGHSVTTATGNGHGGSGYSYAVPFDVTAGDVTLYAYNVDMHQSRNNVTWGCSPYTPPLPAATAAAVIQFGATNLSAFTSDWPNPPNSAWENLLLKYNAGYYLGQQAYSNPGFVLGPSLGWNTPYRAPSPNGGWHCTGNLAWDMFDFKVVYQDLGAGAGFRVTAYQSVHASTDPGSPANTWIPMYDSPGYQDVPEAAVNKQALKPFAFVANQGISGTPGNVTISWSSVVAEGPPAVPTVVYVDDNYAGHSNGDVVDGHVFGYDAFATIAEGIAAVAAGGTVNVAAGPYPENVTVNNRLTLDGAGSGSNPATNTVITPPSGLGMVINASGSSASDRLVIKDLRITGAGSNGIDVDAPNASYLTFDNVACVSNGGSGINTNPLDGSGSFVDIVLANCDLSSNVNAGLRSATYVGINGLTITGGHMDGNMYGWYDAHGSGRPIMTNVSSPVRLSTTTRRKASMWRVWTMRPSPASASSTAARPVPGRRAWTST